MSRKSVDGSFDDFTNVVVAANFDIRGIKVEYQVPGLGMIAFNWDGDLTMDGELIPFDD